MENSRIIVGTYDGPQASLNKSFTTSVEVEGVFKDSFDSISPSIRMNGAIPPVYNYAQYGDNYYYIIDNIGETGGATTLKLKRDPLMTFRSQILNCPAILERSANSWNAYIQDPLRKTYQYTFTQNIEIGQLVGDPSIYLCLMG